jgi:hypothetical protein
MRIVAKSLLTSINFRGQVRKTGIMQERLFIPQKDLNWRHPLPDKNYFPSGWFLTSRSHHAISISQSRNDKAVPRHRIRTPHTEAVTFFSLGFRYPLPKTNHDSYACQKQNSHLQKTTDLPPVVTLSLPVSQTECKKRQLSSVQIPGTSRNSPVNLWTLPKTKDDNSVDRKL